MPKRLKFRKKKYVPRFSKSDVRRIESKNAVLELLQKGLPFIEVHIAHNAHIDPKTREIQRLANAQKIPVRKVMRNIMERQSETSSYESVVGILPKHHSKSLKEILEESKKQRNRTVILLDGIEYSQNLGAILRTSLGAGVIAVIIPSAKGVQVNSEVTRISMGASEIVPVVYMSMYSAIEVLKEFGFSVIGVDMSGPKNYFDEKIWGDTAFLFGSEAKGSTEQILDQCDKIVKIPMKKGVGSLNVNASVGIVVYEKIRQEK